MNNLTEIQQNLIITLGLTLFAFLMYKLTMSNKKDRDARTEKSFLNPKTFNASSLLNRVISVMDIKDDLMLIEIDDDDFFNSRTWIKKFSFPLNANPGDHFLVQNKDGKLYFKAVWLDPKSNSYILNENVSILIS